jgi:hypothetical protein
MLVLLVYAWAERPWHRSHEWRNVVYDVYEAAKTWLLKQNPAPSIQPTIMPFVPQVADILAGMSEFVARTPGDFPPGWAERIAQHRPQSQQRPVP